MKRVVWTMVGCVLASYAVAQNKPSENQLNVTVSVKRGMTEAYETYVKKVVEAANKVGNVQTWWVFESVSGRPGNEYTIVLPFETWSDQDAWIAPEKMLRDAFGGDEAAKISRAGQAATAGSTSEVLQFLPELSSPNPSTGTVQPYYLVSRTEVVPDRIEDYLFALSKIRQAESKAPGAPPRTGRRVIEGNRWMFVGITPFENGAARDRWPDFDKFMSVYTAQERARIMDALRGSMASSEWFEVAYRPELSHTRGGATTN